MNNSSSHIEFTPANRPRSINDGPLIPFYILAPNFRNSSGGIRVLHYLCHILNEMGEEAYILNANTISSRLHTPQLTLEKIKEHFLEGRYPTTIYPEVISDNPANTPIIVRWLLNIPGKLGKPINFEQHDLIYYYEKWCLPPEMDGSPLFIHPVDDSTFNNIDNPNDNNRTLECYYANKYYQLGKPILEEHRNLTSLGQNITRTPEEIAEIFRTAKILYCYEPSGIISEAQACGCPVLLVRSAYWPLPPDDTHHNIPGCAVYSEVGALERAQQSLHQIPKVHINARNNSWTQAKLLVESSYKHLEKLKNTEIQYLNEIQRLWGMGKAERTKSIESFTDYYLKSGLYFSDADKFSASAKSEIKEYKTFLSRSSLQEIDGQLLAERMHKWRTKPTFNIIIELYLGEENLFADTLDSIASQWYPNWHITVIAEFPPCLDIAEIPQISWIEAERNQFTSLLSKNQANIPGDWCCIIEAGCTLEPHALAYLGDTINLDPGAKLIYCDEDRLNSENNRTEPRFKPSFNLEFLRNSYYFGPLLVINRHIFINVGGLRYSGTAGLYDLVLRVSEKLPATALVHQSDILLHTPAVGTRPIDPELELSVVSEHLKRSGINANVAEGFVLGTQRIIYAIQEQPLISIVIPTHNQCGYLSHCVESLITETRYQNYELILVDHQTSDPDALEYLDELRSRSELVGKLKIISNSDPFNYAGLCNFGASVAKGEYILFLDNDIEFIDPEWLSVLLGFAQLKDVAAVAPRLSRPDANLSILNQSARVLGLSGLAGSMAPANASIVQPGYFGNLQISQEVSALSGSCLLISADTFNALNGFNATDTPIHEPVLELCLRIRSSGKKLIWTPWTDVVHHHQATRRRLASDDETIHLFERTMKSEQDYLLSHHLKQLANDPLYHRHLSLQQPFAIEPNFVVDWDQRFHDRLHILGSPLTSGSGEYRMLAPFRALQKAGLAQCSVVHPVAHMVSRILNPIEVARAEPDCFLLQQAIDDTHFTYMKRYRQFNKNLFMAYAVDDVIGNLPKKHHLYNYHVREGKSRLREALSLVDRLIVSTEPIAEFCKDMIDDIIVIPNRLESDRWLGHTSLRQTSKKPRVGWAGAQQHLGDLELIKEVVEATCNEVDWIFMGMCPEFLKPHICEEHKYVKFSDYPAKLATLNLDLAIAPLEQVFFNEGKSNLRLLEYGVMGWPVVCTDVYPYRTNNAPVKRVQNNPKEWIEAIRERVHDLDSTAKEGDRLRDWVMQNYILENSVDEWLSALTPRKLV